MRTEEELARVLRTIAERAEHVDLLSGVVAKRRHRRRLRARVALASACVTILGWGAAAWWPSPPRPVVGTAAPAATVDQVWPRAVFTMPGRYRPLAAISATELLVWGEQGTIEVYDATTRRFTVVARLPQAPRDVAVGSDRVAWLAEDYVWVAPLRGRGAARRVGPVKGTSVDRVTLAGDHVAWSSPLDGVWRMKVDGGAPEKVAKGLQLLDWPWAIDEPLDIRTNPTRVVNLETGRTFRITPARGVEGLRCGPTWCLGMRDDDSVVQRIDGSQVRVRQGLRGHPYRDYPYKDRFFSGGMAIYDAQADRMVPFQAADGGWSEGQGVIFWRQSGQLRGVNLAAVPPAQ
ncbi:hypothetical protein [Thermoactinospora rubra]|uniref:hypothetical protein n=1 Tax=Thermoactinospora rubra TaxID=1088767 RepID=UPI000A1129D3|nr:hypothetical protein [Thermoactinospora rubra]